MPEEHLPIYQIQDFHASEQREHYFYISSFSAHLREHLFIQKPHKHSFYILLFISKGEGTHTIDFKECTVQPNTVFFLAPGQVHSWQLSEETEGYILFFTAGYYLLEFPHKKLVNFPFFNVLFHQPQLMLKDAEHAELLYLVERIQQEHISQKEIMNEVICDYLDILLIQLKRLYQAHKSSEPIPTLLLPQLQALETLIDQHYRQHLPVGYYADQLHVTAKQLNDTCKRAIGKTLTELIQERVLLEARRLLVHSHLTVSEVAASLGYFETNYFFRFFKRNTGFTPEQFRNAQV